MVFRIFLLLTPLFLFSMGYQEPWGKDCELIAAQEKVVVSEKKEGIASKLAHSVIKFHQNYLSPTTGKRSSYRPSSSKYMELAIKRYGFMKGFVMGCDRLLRENNEDWVYRTISINGEIYKYDPAIRDKYLLDP